MELKYVVPALDMTVAGNASTELKRVLGRLGIEPSIIKRTAVAMYEAEINMVIHGGGGVALVDLNADRVIIVLEDHGKGIADLELAMKEGYSTAPERIRELGFGAGMGLPNMKRNSDELKIESSPGKGTKVTILVNFTKPRGNV